MFHKFIKYNTEQDILIIDFSHLLYRNLHIAKEKENHFDFLTHLILNSIIYTIEQFPTIKKVILALDDKNCWRKEIYPEYKGNRKEKRDESDIDFDKLFEFINILIEDLKVFPFKIIKEYNCEADDIIAILCKHIKDPIIILSSDKDFTQLLKYKNVKLYDGIAKKFIKCENVELWKWVKMCIGDSGDNVPGIQKGFGPKTAEKHFGIGIPSNLKEVFKRNQKLMDLDLVPEQYENNIMESYKNYKMEYIFDKVIEFFKKYKLNQFLKFQNFTENILRNLI